MAQTRDQAHIAEVVRRNTMAAAIAALLLCYYGYYGLSEPVVTDLFTRSNWLFYHTLRIGGVMMGGLAAWSLTGMVQALAVDGVVSILIGGLFALSGGGMLIDGGGVSMNTILIIIFGMMFFGTGRRNWLTYRHLTAGGRVSMAEVFTMEETMVPPSVSQPAPPTEPPAVVPEVLAGPAPEPLPDPELESAPEPETPPGGFLASLANQPPPSNE